MADDEAVLGIIETQVAMLMRLGEATRRSTELKPHRALDRAAYVILRQLQQAGPQNVSALAARLNLDGSTVTRQVTALQQDGLVDRHPTRPTAAARSSRRPRSVSSRSTRCGPARRAVLRRPSCRRLDRAGSATAGRDAATRLNGALDTTTSRDTPRPRRPGRASRHRANGSGRGGEWRPAGSGPVSSRGSPSSAK